MNKNILKIAVMIFAAFGIVAGYLTYIQAMQGAELLNHPRNRRLQLLEESVFRGRILDSGGKVLAETVVTGEARQRVYPLGAAAANLTGYVSRKYGRWGLELTYNQELLGIKGPAAEDGLWALARVDSQSMGSDIVLSLDSKLQSMAYKLLGNRKGAVVALEPATGRVLAMVSRPGFDPEQIEADWDDLRVDPDSPLLNRAAQGLYPPGSTMKLVTAAGILAADPETMKRSFDAPGYVVIEGRRIEDKQVQGKVNFTQAFAKSSNYVFATLGLELGAKVFKETAHRFRLDTKLPFELFTAKGNVPEPEEMSKLELGESAIGQGRLLVTPLHMAAAAAAVANGGKMMAPYLVDEIRSPEGKVIKSGQPQALGNPMSPEVSAILRNLMTAAVSGGTGRAAAISGVKVAGKTGSAENPHGEAHAWFIGFAPADRPQVAVAVIIENGGAGGAAAAPVAREIIKGVIEQTR